MRKVNLAEAVSRSSEPVENSERKPILAEHLRAITEDMPRQEDSAGDFMRRLRESDRY